MKSAGFHTVCFEHWERQCHQNIIRLFWNEYLASISGTALICFFFFFSHWTEGVCVVPDVIRGMTVPNDSFESNVSELCITYNMWSEWWCNIYETSLRIVVFVLLIHQNQIFPFSIYWTEFCEVLNSWRTNLLSHRVVLSIFEMRSKLNQRFKLANRNVKCPSFDRYFLIFK